jgi:hypothetical protein
MNIKRAWTTEMGRDLYSISMRVEKEDFFIGDVKTIRMTDMELQDEIHLNLGLLNYNSLLKLYDAIGNTLNVEDRDAY